MYEQSFELRDNPRVRLGEIQFFAFHRIEPERGPVALAFGDCGT